jgi:hypothetical protein
LDRVLLVKSIKNITKFFLNDVNILMKNTPFV